LEDGRIGRMGGWEGWEDGKDERMGTRYELVPGVASITPLNSRVLCPPGSPPLVV